MEVRFQDLHIQAKVFVGARALPSVLNSYRNFFEVRQIPHHLHRSAVPNASILLLHYMSMQLCKLIVPALTLMVRTLMVRTLMVRTETNKIAHGFLCTSVLQLVHCQNTTCDRRLLMNECQSSVAWSDLSSVCCVSTTAQSVRFTCLLGRDFCKA